MKILWLTDLHLDFLDAESLNNFCIELEDATADALLVSGDIGQAPTAIEFVRELHIAARCPVYFVFGNHDYYFGSIKSLRAHAAQLYSSGPIQWLSVSGVIPLTKSTCCVGHDGWGDGRNGDYAGSRVMLSDFEVIEELAGLSRGVRLEKIRALGDEAALHMQKILPQALSSFHHVVVVTHVPPFPESAWWEGKLSAPEWLPYFSCKAVGDVLKECMEKNPENQMTVLCGHTHGGGQARILDNLVVMTGSAEYGNPRIQKVFEW